MAQKPTVLHSVTRKDNPGLPWQPGWRPRLKCYTILTMRREAEDYFLNPPPGSAAARAVEFGIDLTLTLENLRLTPEERIRKLDNRLAAIAESKAVEHYPHPKDLLMLLELEAIQEYQQSAIVGRQI